VESVTALPPADPELRELLGTLSDLGSAAAVLGWDRETMMPPQGAEYRGEVMATLEQLAHRTLADPRVAQLTQRLAAAAQPGSVDAAIARVVARDHERAVCIPVELTAEIERASAAAIPAWAAAREASDFAAFQPHLERQVELRRDLAACFPDVAHPYDALLQPYEPGATTAGIRDVFATLRAGLVPLVEEIAQRPAPEPLPSGLPEAGQRTLALEVARALGFDERSWRLDDSTHPFSQSAGPRDQRVTARWDESDLSGLFAVMHEAGHSLYEEGVDPPLARTTLGSGVSMGIHESQSRLWENQVGRSRAFWSFWLPRAQELLPPLRGLDLDDVLRRINVVRPSLIRVEADEVTYALHVILRFELEVALIDGTLAVADLPAAWGELMVELLGVAVPDDRNGCLQDVHWAFGEFGYFPTYAIGNIVSAQLWRALRSAVPGVQESIAAGDCAPVRDWLREHVHRFGRRLDPPELLQQATGAALDPAPLLEDLRLKYAELYDLA
jgi:carboxypeptidase Taq